MYAVFIQIWLISIRVDISKVNAKDQITIIETQLCHSDVKMKMDGGKHHSGQPLGVGGQQLGGYGGVTNRGGGGGGVPRPASHHSGSHHSGSAADKENVFTGK